MRSRLLRRLRAVHGHVAAATAVIGGEEVELIPHDEPRQHSDSVGTFERSARWTPDGHRNPGSRGAGPALLQDEEGVVLPEELERLQREKRDAVEAEDYRTAAAYQALLEVVTPRPSALPQPLASYVTGADFSEEDVQSAADFFLEYGFCVAPGAVGLDTLERVRAGWPAAEAEAQELWQERAAVSRGRWGLSWASGAPTGFRTFFDLGLQPEAGGPHWGLACALTEVAASPGLLATAKLVLGGGAKVGGFPGGRVVPPEHRVPGPEPGTIGGDGGYTSWHRCARAPQPLPSRSPRLTAAAGLVFAATLLRRMVGPRRTRAGSRPSAASGTPTPTAAPRP